MRSFGPCQHLEAEFCLLFFLACYFSFWFYVVFNWHIVIVLIYGIVYLLFLSKGIVGPYKLQEKRSWKTLLVSKFWNTQPYSSCLIVLLLSYDLTRDLYYLCFSIFSFSHYCFVIIVAGNIEAYTYYIILNRSHPHIFSLI
jgi:hypothetical protein